MSDDLDKKRALQYLEQEALLNMGMIEPINRGTAELLYSGNDGVLLFEKKSNAYMISVDGPELAEKHLGEIDQAELFLAHQQFCVPMISKKFGLTEQLMFLQAAYLKNTLIPIDEKTKIHTLNNTHTKVVLEHYHTMDDPSYITKLIENGQIFGAFINDHLAGFIGIHLEGSIGMLEVLPDFRRQGIGYTLESYIINSMIEKGRVPFCQVFEDNLNSINLQKKLGLELSKKCLYWLF
ncbi:MAG: GNAT family N-acetyltransferase [Eubacteriaceae bacterium]